jgi:hypothetical protein
MATERLSMRKTREILRHKWVLGLGYRDVASSVDVSLGGVWLVVDRAKKAGLDWPAVEALDDAALEARVHTRDLQAGLTRPIPRLRANRSGAAPGRGDAGTAAPGIRGAESERVQLLAVL